MAEEEMAKVKVTRSVVVIPIDKDGKRVETSTVLYEARDEPYTAPRSHIEQIVSSGAGERVGEELPARQQPPVAAPAPSQAKPAAPAA